MAGTSPSIQPEPDPADGGTDPSSHARRLHDHEVSDPLVLRLRDGWGAQQAEARLCG